VISTLGGLISIMLNTLFPFVITQFSTAFGTITSNPILYLPVLIGLSAVVIMFVIKLVRRLGVRGNR